MNDIEKAIETLKWENLVKYARVKESEVEQDEANNQV